MPRTATVITVASRPHKARGHLRSLRRGMACSREQPMHHVLLSQEKLNPVFSDIHGKQKLPAHVLELWQVKSSGGIACAAKIN